MTNQLMPLVDVIAKILNPGLAMLPMSMDTPRARLMLLAMVHTEHSGNFTIQAYSRRGGDGRFIAIYVVTEAQAGADVEIKASTATTFENEDEAIEAASQAAKKWLGEYRPTNALKVSGSP